MNQSYSAQAPLIQKSPNSSTYAKASVDGDGSSTYAEASVDGDGS